MTPRISERAFEDAIERGLLQHGPDALPGDWPAIAEGAAPFGDMPPGGYLRRRPEDYDRTSQKRPGPPPRGPAAPTPAPPPTRLGEGSRYS